MKILNNQIIRFDGKDTFFEVMSNSLPIGKVQINFRKYDESKAKGSKMVQQVDCFLDIPEALRLCQDILSGKISKLAEAEKKKGAAYPAPIFQSMGGINAEKAKERKLRDDGMALSRVIKLAPGSSKPFIFTGESGKGEENDKGLIVPRYGKTPENRVMVALTDDQLKEFALMVMYHVQGYITSQYTSGAYIKEITK